MTYTAHAKRGFYGEREEYLIYAGDSLEKAMERAQNYQVDLLRFTFVQIWQDGKVIKTIEVQEK